ncbi:MAG: hypothetical protein ACM3SY_14245 [Candidatus Omnitrophota bacterium]
MKKITKESIISIAGQDAIKAGVRTCADACSDYCVASCPESGSLNGDTALQWGFGGVWGPDKV